MTRRSQKVEEAECNSHTSPEDAAGKTYRPIKVTMNFGQRDIDNTNFLINAFRARSKGAAVSMALGLTKRIAGYIEEGAPSWCGPRRESS